MKRRSNYSPTGPRPRKHSTLPQGSHKAIEIPDAHPSATGAERHNAKVAASRALIYHARRQRIARQTEK